MRSISHALRHVASLLKALSKTVSRTKDVPTALPVHDYISRLLDSLLSFQLVGKREDSLTDLSALSVIQCALDILSTSNDCSELETIVRNKTHSVLVLLCSNMLAEPKRLLSEGECGVASRSIFCLALVQVAKSAA